MKYVHTFSVFSVLYCCLITWVWTFNRKCWKELLPLNSTRNLMWNRVPIIVLNVTYFSLFQFLLPPFFNSVLNRIFLVLCGTCQMFSIVALSVSICCNINWCRQMQLFSMVHLLFFCFVHWPHMCHHFAPAEICGFTQVHHIFSAWMKHGVGR